MTVISTTGHRLCNRLYHYQQMTIIRAKHMSQIRPYRMIDRRKSRQIQVGSVAVGGDAPISVQTTNR